MIIGLLGVRLKIVHYIIKKRPAQTELHNSRMHAAKCLPSDLTIISDWGRISLLVFFNVSETNFLRLSTRQHLPDIYPYSSETLSCHPLLQWKFHISCVAKSVSANLVFCIVLDTIFLPHRCCQYSKTLTAPIQSVHLMCEVTPPIQLFYL